MWLLPWPFQLKVIVSDGFVISQLSWLSYSKEIKGRGTAEGLKIKALKTEPRVLNPKIPVKWVSQAWCSQWGRHWKAFERAFLGSPQVALLVITLGTRFQTKGNWRGRWEEFVLPQHALLGPHPTRLCLASSPASVWSFSGSSGWSQVAECPF